MPEEKKPMTKHEDVFSRIINQKSEVFSRLINQKSNDILSLLKEKNINTYTAQEFLLAAICTFKVETDALDSLSKESIDYIKNTLQLLINKWFDGIKEGKEVVLSAEQCATFGVALYADLFDEIHRS